MPTNPIVEALSALPARGAHPVHRQAPSAAQLRLDVSGCVERRVVHAGGDLDATGGDLLLALGETLLLAGCRRIRLDLAAVTTMDEAGRIALQQLQSMLAGRGATLWVTHRSHVRFCGLDPAPG